MPAIETSKESGRTVKPGKTTVNGEPGSHAHASDGAQAETLTASAVASLLKSDLTPTVEDLQTDLLQTRSDEEDSQQTTVKGKETEEPKAKPAEETEEEEETTEAQGQGAKQKAEAQAQVTQWSEIVAELEQKLEGAEADSQEAKQLETEIAAAKTDLNQWEQLAAGATGAEGSEAPAVPEALQQAITQWEADGGGELPPALQTLVDKKIHKLTGRAKQAETRVEELEAQLETARSAPAGAKAPLMDPQRLEVLEQNGERMAEDLEAVIDGAATDEEKVRVSKALGVPSEHLDTAEGQRAAKRQLRAVQKFVAGIPAERQRVATFRAEEAKVAPIAKQVFPFLYDPAHPDYGVAQHMLSTVPDLAQRTPNHQMALGFLVLGRREAMRLHPELFGGATRTGPRKAPPVPRKAPGKSPASAGSAAAPQGARTRARDAEETAARAQHDKRPTAATVSRLLKASLRS